MVDKSNPGDSRASGFDQSQSHSPSAPVAPPRHSLGHRAPDMRDAMAELAERAQIISQEAGTKVAAAMKDVISAAAGIAGFALESARDLVQFMVRRGQMTQEEADKLIREAEEAHGRRTPDERSRPTATKVAAERAAHAKAEAAARAEAALAAMHAAPRPLPPARPAKPVLAEPPKAPEKKVAAKKATPEPAKKHTREPEKKAAAKSSKPAPKAAAKSAPKSAAKKAPAKKKK
jgi:polyhydroxyalkanoate synthesis regulator phasin